MKNYFSQFLFLVLLNVTPAYSQTQQETINWLKSKLQQSGTISAADQVSPLDNFRVCCVKDCHLIVAYDTYDKTLGSILLQEEIPLSPELEYNNNGLLSLKYKGIRHIIVPHENNTSSWFEKRYQFAVSNFIISETEENLRNRVMKALKHLATFCSPPSGETF